MKRTLHLYKKLKKYFVDTLTLSSVTANDTWQKKVEYLFFIRIPGYVNSSIVSVMPAKLGKEEICIVKTTAQMCNTSYYPYFVHNSHVLYGIFKDQFC